MLGSRQVTRAHLWQQNGLAIRGCATVLSLSLRRLQASASHAAAQVFLWRALAFGLSVYTVEPRPCGGCRGPEPHRMAYFFVQPSHTDRSGRSLWRLAIALKQAVYAEQRLDVYSVSSLLPEEWARVHRQRPIALASHLCTVVASGPDWSCL